jgi:predicted AAA+ superfamily ATPase
MRYNKTMTGEINIHNLFKKDIDLYIKNDPYLSGLKEYKYIFRSPLEKELPIHTPGIYIITGARQVGKTTFLKLLIKKLLIEDNISPKQIFYITCDLFQRFEELNIVLQQVIKEVDLEKHFYIFLDEITYVKEWDRAIKYFADMGYLKNSTLIITGSDSVILKEAMKKFPGRRGQSAKTDFHYWPISFSEYLKLMNFEINSKTKKLLDEFIENPLDISFKEIEKGFDTKTLMEINKYFERYLITGGFITAINNFEKSNKIDKYVYQTYLQWVIGDFLKKNKKEYFLKEIIFVLFERIAKQITFSDISSKTQIQHHATVEDYLSNLEDMDIIFIQYALREDKLKKAYKKAKKIHFSDPFIATTLLSWANEFDEWDFVNKNIINETQFKSSLIENVIVSLFRRKYKTFYIKSEGEVDLALIFENKIIPIEIKWSDNLKKGDLKQILKFKKGIIAYKGPQFGRFEHLYVIPAPILATIP